MGQVMENEEKLLIAIDNLTSKIGDLNVNLKDQRRTNGAFLKEISQVVNTLIAISNNQTKLIKYLQEK